MLNMYEATKNEAVHHHGLGTLEERVTPKGDDNRRKCVGYNCRGSPPLK